MITLTNYIVTIIIVALIGVIAGAVWGIEIQRHEINTSCDNYGKVVIAKMQYVLTCERSNLR